MSEKKIDLISQLLAKAESTTPEEAEALREHAYRLMQKYMIDQAVIDARRLREGKSHEQIVTKIIRFEGQYRADLIELGTYVVFALGQMRPLQSKGRIASQNAMHRNGTPVTYLHIVGFESDVEQAELLIRSLHVQALLAVKQWWAGASGDYSWRPESDKVRARHTFVSAFGSGAAARIRENRKQVIEEASSGTDLVLVDRGNAVDQWIEENMNVGKGRSKGRQRDYSASVAGNHAGRNAATGERSMTQGRGLPAGRS